VTVSVFHDNGGRCLKIARSSLLSNISVRSRKVAVSIPDQIIAFFSRPNPSSRTMALGSTQPLIEMSNRNFPRGKGRPARKADSLIATCEPTV
jgi:hypothetical protein